MLLNEELSKYKREVDRLQARLEQYEKHPRISSFQNVSGDSIVSQFSVDRAAANALKNIEIPSSFQPEINFEKQELLAKIESLELQIENEQSDLRKCHKLIKGLRKLVPVSLFITVFITNYFL